MSRIHSSSGKEFGKSIAVGIWIDPVAVMKYCTRAMSRLLLLASFLFLFSSFAFAAMTIYLKDGGSRQVHKIVFQGEKADLYLLDGQVITMKVDQIDLQTSGIGAPVGTYGQTRVGPTRKVGNTPKPLGVDEEARQEDLREEWEKSSKTAIATRAIGNIRKGDQVKIVGQSSNPSVPSGSRNTDRNTLSTKRTFSDTAYYGREEPVNPDQAYVIIYKNPDGTFAKKLFDAATFSTYFKFPDPPKQTSSRPIVPQLPPDPDRETREPVLTIPEETSPMESESRTSSPRIPNRENEAAPSTGRKADEESLPAPAKSRTPVFIGLIVLVVAGGVGFLIWKGRKKAFLDTSKFAQYEEDLRDFEIAIWLRNGKTEEQLKEICLKKFFQDNPAALSIATKMSKGGERSWLIPYIIKLAGSGMEEADEIYRGIQERLDRIQSLIREVSSRTGIIPQSASTSLPVDVTQKTVRSVPTSTPVVPSSARSTAGPEAPSSPPSLRPSLPNPPVPVIPPTGSSTSSLAIHPISDRSERSKISDSGSGTGEAPSYISNVLNQLGFLSDSDEESSRS